MAAPTTSRATLRRELARRLRMPFSLLVGNSSTFTGTPTTTTFRDGTRLTQKDDFWNRQYVYVIDGPAAGDVREISDFYDANNEAFVDVPFTSAPAAGNTYEIHSRWSATDLHTAIDYAIDQAFPAFFSVTVDETIPVQRDTLTYSLPGSPYHILRMWLGQHSTLERSIATAGGATTLTDSLKSWTVNQFANQKVSIIEGTGKGQIRTIASNTATVLTVSSAWTTNPDSTSVYVIWEAVREVFEWYRLFAVRFDQSLWPATYYLANRYQSWEGMPFRIEYVGKPAALTTEAATTPVPAEYIYPKAMAYLYGLRLSEVSRADLDRYVRLQQTFETLAEAYRTRERWQMPPGTNWQEFDYTLWRNLPREYPF